MSDQEHDVLADLAAQMTGTVGIDEDAGLDQAVPDALADDVDAYDEFAERRDAHLAVQPDDQQDAVEDEAQEDPPTNGKRVPLAALQQERAQRQQLQMELEQHRLQVAQLQAYQQQVQQFLAQQQAAQHQAQIPAFEDDPQGHVEAVKQQFADELGAMRQQLQSQQIAAQVHADASVIAPGVHQAETDFAAQVGVENYASAFDHVRLNVQQQLMQRFPGASPQELATVEVAASIAFARQCQAEGSNPAQKIWERAQALGFNPGQRVPNAQRRQPPTSLSNIPAGGRAPDEKGRITGADIAAMSQKDFDALFDSMRDASVQIPAF